jgi:hypothetical protein
VGAAMRFKIISVGWNCADYLTQTLASIEEQTLSNYDVMIIDDMSDDPRQAQLIREWCESRDERWNYQINTERKFAVRNQYEGIQLLDPEDKDVIVFLDLDGDRLAHPRVLETLTNAYSDGTLLTYGNYLPVPDPGTCPPCDPFPEHVIAQGTIRQEILYGFCHFNHLRTMRGQVFKSIPKDYFFFEGTQRWYDIGTDYVFMVPGLELASRRYKWISEVLCLYNHDNPLADNRTHASGAVIDSLRRPALAPLIGDEVRMSEPVEIHQDRFLPAEARRRLLREAGSRWRLRNFIETGTSSGDTMEFLHDHFSVLHTIELDQPTWQRAFERLASYMNVAVWPGDSTEVLPRVLKMIDGPALIWLDGHYSGPGTARGSLDTPVVAEINTVFSDVNETGRKHVIYIDDARIFDEGPEHNDEPHYADYPSLTWVRQIAEAQGYDYLLEDDIIRLTPRS